MHLFVHLFSRKMRVIEQEAGLYRKIVHSLGTEAGRLIALFYIEKAVVFSSSLCLENCF